MFEFNFHDYGSIDAKDYDKEKKLLGELKKEKNFS